LNNFQTLQVQFTASKEKKKYFTPNVILFLLLKIESRLNLDLSLL
jgi:hypothetical protein